MAYAKRTATPDGKAGVQAVFTDTVFLRSYPAVYEYLTLTKWEDGTQRQPSTMLLLVEEGFMKACLNDRANQRSAWVSGASLTDTMKCLDDGLKDDTLVWRKNQPWEQKRGKK